MSESDSVLDGGDVRKISSKRAALPNCSLSVHLDNMEPVLAGNAIKGHVVLECLEEDDLRSLQIQIQGEERVTAKHSSYSTSNLFLLLNPAIEYGSKLQEGTNVFSFEATIPANLCPSSLPPHQTNGRTGSIEYSIVAFADTPSLKLESKKVHFDVLEAFTSRLHPVSVEDALNGRVGGNALAKVSMHLTQQTFALGQIAVVTLDIASNKGVPHVIISLIKTITLKEGDKTFQTSQQVSRIVHPIKHAPNSKQERQCKIRIPANTEPSVHGTRATLHYHITATIHIASLIPQELEVSAPVVLCHPTVYGTIPKLQDKKLSREEFEVPLHAGEANTEVQGIRLIPKTAIKGETFYKTSQTLYCDVPDESFNSLCLRIHSNKKVTVRGRYNELPTLFSADVQACELSPGKYLLNIDEHSSPRLRPGRWFFTVTGSSFMQSSVYQILLILSPTHNNAEGESESEIEEIVYENQKRNSPFGAYSMLDMDFPPWSTKSGTVAPCKEDFSLPDGWYWKTKWTVAPSRINRDEKGWQYATGWNSTSWKNQSRAIHLVRRRIWKRTRAIKPPGYVDSPSNLEALDELLDEFEVIPSNKKPDEIFLSPDDDSVESSSCSKNELSEDLQSPSRHIDESDSSLANSVDSPSTSVVLDISGGDPSDLEISFHAEDSSEKVDELAVNPEDIIPTEEEEEEEEGNQFTLEEVERANALAEEELQQEEEVYKSQVILDQEKKDRERREREEAEFQQKEKERLERAQLLQQQREAEQKQREEEWKQREEQVRKQLELDQKRLEMLQTSESEDLLSFTDHVPSVTPVLQPTKTEVPIQSTSVSYQQSFAFDDDEEDDEIFEVLTDSED